MKLWTLRDDEDDAGDPEMTEEDSLRASSFPVEWWNSGVSFWITGSVNE